MLFDDEFKESVVSALEKKLSFEEDMNYICDYLKEVSHSKYNYYFNSGGFICVDVGFDDVDEHISFFEDIVNCKYTSIRNLDGVTLLVSLSTLKECIF